MKTGQHTDENLVFISHDHREEAIAKFVADAISDLSGGTLPTFYSSARTATSGIEYGKEWFQKVEQKLRSTTYFVCILTPQSIHRTWIYFEAGFARGKHGGKTPIVALLAGVDSVEVKAGPFAHFRFVRAELTEMAELLRQIAEHAGFAPTDSSTDATAKKLIKRINTFSAKQKGSNSIDALRAYRACMINSKLTFGLIEYLNEHDKGDDAEIAEWIKARSHMNPSEAHRRRVLFSLLKVGVLITGAKHIKITKLGLRIYDNLIHLEKDPDPVPGELDVYRSLLKDMNFVPKILSLLFTEAQYKMSHDALMKIVRGEWEPSELPRSQAEIAFEKVLEMLLRARVVETEEGQTVYLTERGRAMCGDLFGV